VLQNNEPDAVFLDLSKVDRVYKYEYALESIQRGSERHFRKSEKGFESLDLLIPPAQMELAYGIAEGEEQGKGQVGGRTPGVREEGIDP